MQTGKAILRADVSANTIRRNGATIAIAIMLVFLLPDVSMAGERAYRVRGVSMSPALSPGDTVIVSDSPEFSPVRGDLVALNFPRRESPMVKRAVAIAGDRVEVRNGSLFINGNVRRQIDPERWRTTLAQLERNGWVVPEGTVLVLGDNPENSRDSRRLGLIPLSRIEGKVTRVIHEKDEY